MIFLRYESFRSYLRQFPVTAALIALNIIYFIIVVWNGDSSDVMDQIKFGAFVTDPELDPFGVLQPWRYVTSIFMHAGLEHLLYNMFALLVFAPPLERLLKSARYTLFYLLCGIAGHVMSALAHSLEQEFYIQVDVGASGAIYGIYGAFLYISLFRKSQLDQGSRKTVYVILIFGVIFSMLASNVNLWAHIGGALAGFLLYNIFDRMKTRGQQRLA